MFLHSLIWSKADIQPAPAHPTYAYSLHDQREWQNTAMGPTLIKSWDSKEFNIVLFFLIGIVFREQDLLEVIHSWKHIWDRFVTFRKIIGWCSQVPLTHIQSIGFREPGIIFILFLVMKWWLLVIYKIHMSPLSPAHHGTPVASGVARIWQLGRPGIMWVGTHVRAQKTT